MQAESTFSLKDQLFNSEKVDYLADLLGAAYPDFPRQEFCKTVVDAFSNPKLKQRIEHIAGCLHNNLPTNYPTAIEILLRALPPELDPTKTDDDFGDFIFSPHSNFVARYGCTAEHLDLSLHALMEMTKRFSAEYAVRFFINSFPDKTLPFLKQCATHNNYHVRRWASEGTRPKLPWEQKLVLDYRDPLPILDALYTDRTRYVTRSVANHLNDISKIDPALAIDTLTR